MAFQYAAKFVCGTSKEFTPVANGQYETVVNVHNPGKKTKFRFKLAVAEPGKDGKIFPFHDAAIDEDAAQYYDCKVVRAVFGIGAVPALFEGFFVIQSETSLDVVAVYTTNDSSGKGVPVIEVERVFERKL